jgi:hypothetical protein
MLEILERIADLYTCLGERLIGWSKPYTVIFRPRRYLVYNLELGYLSAATEANQSWSKKKRKAIRFPYDAALRVQVMLLIKHRPNAGIIMIED